MATINVIEQIFNKMPNNLTQLGKARFLYLESCRLFTFSTKFQNTDDASFVRMYTQKVDAAKLETTEVNCRMWSQVYSQLLDKANIKNTIVDNGHQHVKIYIDNEEWIADSTYGNYTDFSRVKNNDRTSGFGYNLYQGGKKNVISIDEKYINMLDDIDKKIGYNNDQMEELMEFRNLLTNIKNGSFDINELSVEPIKDKLVFKLEYLFSHLGKLNCGYYEAKDFVFNLENCLLGSNEFKCLKAVELKRTNKDKSVDILQCIYTLGDNPNYYLLAPNLPIIKISESHLMNLAVRGYGLDEGKQINGISYPRDFKAGKISKIDRIKLYKDKILGNFAILNEYTKVR